LKRRVGLAALWVAGLALVHPLSGQEVRLDAELPRIMVFVDEDGATATSRLTAFLREAGFTVLDPAFTRTVAQRDLARRAVDGDDAAATQLGRDLGAQVIVLGAVPAEDRPSPSAPNLTLGTATVALRALRLDESRIVSELSAEGRGLDATGQAARRKAVDQAVQEVLYQTSFMGDLLIDWDERPWQDDRYWDPSPGSVEAQVGPEARIEGPAKPAQRAERPGVVPPPRPTSTGAVAANAAAAAPAGAPEMSIAILESNAFPEPGGGPARRSIEIVAAQNRIARVRGVVTGPATSVTVGTHTATTRALSAPEAEGMGLRAGTAFEAEVPLGPDDDRIRVRAQGADGEVSVEVTPEIGARWAVVVGISEYADTRIPALSFADDDARAMAAFLRSPEGGSVPDANLRVLIDEEATAEALREALFVFLQQAAPEDLVTVYLASHGSPDPSRPSNLYVLTYDTDVDAMAATAFPMWDVKTALRRQITSERVVVIADACRSAGTLVDDANPMGGAFSGLFNPSRRLTLSAAGVNQVSFEDAKWGGGHGVFTHFFLEGLQGGADADGDGVVTFREVAAFVAGKVPGETGGAQTPEWSGLGDVPLATVAGGSG
jgi:hypothetical protein